MRRMIRIGTIAPVLLLAVLLRWLRRSAGATKNEVVQAAFSALVTAFLVLTATGIWFRGTGMALVWPWNR